MIKLNIGCNDVIFQDWINLDLHPHAGAIVCDARQPLPYTDNSVSFIFSEHFIEHLNETEALNFFKECYRVLEPGGVIRTTTFDVDDIMNNCSTDDKWDVYKKWLYDGLFSHMTRTQFFNLAIYEGTNHKYMYNPDEMERFLRLAGFAQFNRPIMKESMFLELQNREWRCNSNCIVEAMK